MKLYQILDKYSGGVRIEWGFLVLQFEHACEIYEEENAHLLSKELIYIEPFDSNNILITLKEGLE